MPVLFQYLIKLSISLAIMYLFYQLVLRRLTFYNHNRWYLLGYSVLCFFISVINIAPIFESSQAKGYELINMLPTVGDLAVNTGTIPVENNLSPITWWDWGVIVLVLGILALSIRIIIQFSSLRRLRKSARLVTGEGIRFYQVNKNIIPFSFGNSIYVNQHLHTESELKEIVRHEFVHVKQVHTVDIIWSELLCILNWYNPFAWLIKKAIRQNLEFIADHKVIANGVDKTQYQYLLLKVMGNNQFSIASQFNFTSLKKRIVMMNKISTARVHLVKFLFVLPLLAVLLLAFRSPSKQKPVLKYATIVIDADTKKPISKAQILNVNTGKSAQTDEKGYFSMVLPADQPIHVKMLVSKNGYTGVETNTFSLEKKDNTESVGLMEVIYLKKGNTSDKCTGCGSSIRFFDDMVDKLGYDDVKKYYEKLLIGLPAYVDTIPAKAAGSITKSGSRGLHRDDAMSSENKAFFNRNTNVNLLYWKNDGSVEVYLNSGKVERYSGNDMKELEKKYGALPVIKAANTLKPASSGQPKSPASTMSGLSLKAGKEKPIIFVDGKEWPADLDMSLNNSERIESLNVIKGEDAVKLYGDRAKDGVIAIITRKQKGISFNAVEGNVQPVYYLNGKKVSRETVEMMDPQQIKSVEVFKGQEAIDKFGEDGKNGVIEITVPVV